MCRVWWLYQLLRHGIDQFGLDVSIRSIRGYLFMFFRDKLYRFEFGLLDELVHRSLLYCRYLNFYNLFDFLFGQELSLLNLNFYLDV